MTAAALGRPSIPFQRSVIFPAENGETTTTDSIGRREPNWALLDERERGGSKITDAELNATKKNYASATLLLAAFFLHLEVINLLLLQKQSDFAFCSFYDELYS